MPPHPPLEGQAPTHPPLGGQTSRFADLPDVISRLDGTPGLKETPKTFEIAVSIASEYEKVHRVEEAALYFGQAFEKTAELRGLFVQRRGVEVGATPCEAVDADKALELEVAKAKAQKPPAMQAACLGLLVPKAVDVGKRLALFQVLAKDMEGAKKTWEALWALDETSLEAAYALGVLLLETEGDNMAALKRAEQLLKKVASAQHLRANSAKGFLGRIEAALEAGGNSKVQRPTPNAHAPRQAPTPL